MTHEQYTILQQYEETLSKAQNGYCRALSSQSLKKLNEVYIELFGEESRLLSGCSACVLKGLKKLAKAYFENPVEEKKEEQVQEQLEPKEEIINTEASVEAPKKKRNNKATKNEE